MTINIKLTFQIPSYRKALLSKRKTKFFLASPDPQVRSIENLLSKIKN